MAKKDVMFFIAGFLGSMRGEYQPFLYFINIITKTLIDITPINGEFNFLAKIQAASTDFKTKKSSITPK